MLKNLSAYIDLCILVVSCKVSIATPGEVLNLINKDEFTLAFLILGIGIVSILMGVGSLGSLKDYLIHSIKK